MNIFSRSSSVARTHLGQTHTNLNMENDKVNFEEYSMEDIDRNFLEWNKWNIPTERTDKIYRQTTFSKLTFLTDYTIKTVERTYSLFNEYETIQLFSLDSINKHRENICLFTCWSSTGSYKTFNKRSFKYKCFTLFERWQTFKI